LIEYLREALSVTWQAGRVSSFKYIKLTDAQEKGLSRSYLKYGEQLTASKNKTTWNRCFEYEQQAKDKHPKLHFTLFQSDVTTDLSKPLIKVICSTKRLDDLEAEVLFKDKTVIGARQFNGLECFMYLNPNKSSSDMTPHEIESRISYGD